MSQNMALLLQEENDEQREDRQGLHIHVATSMSPQIRAASKSRITVVLEYIEVSPGQEREKEGDEFR